MSWLELLRELDELVDLLAAEGGVTPLEFDERGADLEYRVQRLHDMADHRRGLPVPHDDHRRPFR